MITRLYPGGKKRAFNISYDDGILQDIRFVELLNRYGLKGTFNLNSGLMRSEFEWTHESGMLVKRLSENTAAGLYQGHEVASHTLTHPYMESLAEGDILHQMVTDRRNLTELFDTEVYGFAVPFLYYSDLIASCVRQAGFEYARISEESKCYDLPWDYYHWRGSIFHWSEDLEEFVDGFLVTDQELALCQIVGHSYDLDVGNMWDRLEAICQKVSRAGDVCPMTNLELVRYSKAMRAAEITDSFIRNHAPLDIWFRVGEHVVRLHPGETFDFGRIVK